MRCIRYVTCLAAGLILFPVSAGPIQMQNSKAAGIYFPPPGQSIDNQNCRRPEEVGVRPEIVARLKAIMQGNRWALWRHGYLIHVDGDFNKNTEVASLRKTWHALTVGAAIGQGKIPSVHQKINVWCKELTGKDAEATWWHVITQTSGFDYPYGQHPAYEPGQMWTYSDKNPRHLCKALARVYGKRDYTDDYDDVVSRAYFDAIDLRGWTTRVNQDGIRFQFDLEDMGRLGLLVLARGRWRDKQVIPQSFVEQLETKQTHGAEVNYSGPDDGNVGLDPKEFVEAPYGFMTWVNTDGDLFPGADKAWAWGAGAGGTRVLWNHKNGIIFAGFGVPGGASLKDGIPHIIESGIIESDIEGRNPVAGATDVQRDVVLSWTPGEYAQAVNGHIVYLSDNFNDVNDGIGDITQSTSNYAPPRRLEFGTTYYWRVDEVNAPPDSTVYPGEVWSFKTEPYALPIENITATASSYDPGAGPENTVDGSGLNENDEHSKDETAMWLSAADGPQPVWIKFDLDRVYKLHQMLVWNYNIAFEEYLGFGFKEVSVEYSENGTEWAALGDVEFAQGPGEDSYASDTPIDLGGVMARYIKLTAKNNWSGEYPQFGLSEVRFLYVPVQAREPDPYSGTSDVDIDMILGWRVGREAVSHDVYIGTDPDALALADSVAEPSFDTASLGLELGQDYYWRIDEVNVAQTTATWEGELWSFSTKESLSVDGFESYNDIPTGEEDSRLVYAIWSDGLVDPSKGGSQIGYFTDTSLETNIVHGGRQSLPLTYNNRSASVSEVTVDPAKLPIGRDWTKGAPETLVLWFYGQSGNAVTEKMYVNVGSVKVPYPGNAADVTRPIWKQWNVDLAALGIDLSNVGQHGISFERTEATGGAGTIFIDDILLYRSAPAMADGGPNARFDVAKLARWREMSTQAMFVAAAMCGISSDGTAAPVMSPAEIRLTGD